MNDKKKRRKEVNQGWGGAGDSYRNLKSGSCGENPETITKIGPKGKIWKRRENLVKK